MLYYDKQSTNHQDFLHSQQSAWNIYTSSTPLPFGTLYRDAFVCPSDPISNLSFETLIIRRV